MSSKLKILLLGDYSNCQATLSKGLKELGHDVTLISPVNYLSSGQVDIDTSRRNGKIGGLEIYFKALTLWHKYLMGYDIVSINDPNFLMLAPARLLPLFKRLKKENRSIFYNAMSIDINYLRVCAQNNSPLKFSEFFIEGKPSPWYLQHPDKLKSWFNPKLIEYQDYVFENLDGAVAVLYEYYLALENRFSQDKIAYGGIPISTSEIPYIGPNLDKRIRILLCRDQNRIKLKGSDLLEQAVLKIKERYPQDVELKIAENLPYSVFIEEIKKSDVILDQVYSYTPATTALISMAMGKTVVSGGENEFYEFIGEKENRPVINASYRLDKLIQSIKEVALDRNFISTNALNSRKFVEKHNDSKIVAQRYLDFWKKTMKL